MNNSFCWNLKATQVLYLDGGEKSALQLIHREKIMKKIVIFAHSAKNSRR